jgi:DMSO/TMAO reductase YedYZ heme-binding membrane subunit
MTGEMDASGLPRNRLWQPTTAKWFLVVFGGSVGYAIIRYHFVKDVAWAHFPLFILNKATALAAVIFVGCSYLVGRVIKWHNHDPVIRLVVVKFCGLMGFALAGIHAFMSFFLLTPPYFAKYFAADGRLNLQGELGMAVGIVALWALVSPAITTLPMMPKALGGKRWKRTQRMGYLALVLVVAHLVVLGVKGWLTPGKWSWMPPVSLLAVLAAAFPILVKVRETSRKAKG